jgi:hypothetical protein
MRLLALIGLLAAATCLAIWMAASRRESASLTNTLAPLTEVASQHAPQLDEAGAGRIRSVVAPQDDVAVSTTEPDAQNDSNASDTESSVPTPGLAVSGVLVIPDGWPDGLPSIRAHRVGDRSLSDPETGLLSDPVQASGCATYEWSLVVPQSGNYEFWSQDPPHVVELPVGAPLHGVRVEVPAPTHLFVRTVDAVTGDNIIVDSLSWRPVGPHDSRAQSYRRAFRDADRGIYDLACVAGVVRVSCDAMDQMYEPVHKIVEINSSTPPLTLPLVRMAAVRVDLVDAGSTHISDMSEVLMWKSLVVPDTSGDGRVLECWRTESTGFVTIYVSKSGRYRVDLKDLPPGVWTYDPAYADIKLGETTNVSVRVTRKP